VVNSLQLAKIIGKRSRKVECKKKKKEKKEGKLTRSLAKMAAAASSRKKRKHLNLEEKVDLILYSEKHPELGTRAVAACYDIGKTQASDILKNKLHILTEFKSYGSTYKKYRKSKYADVNEALYDWYSESCSENNCPNGPQLVAKAKEIAASLDIPHFEGSSGWLFKWKKRYNVKKMSISRDPCKVPGSTVAMATTTTWKKTLQEIVEGYDQEDIFNLDEMCLYWKALPSREFGKRGKKCCGRCYKSRLTITFLVNAAGSKEKPLVVWSSERPQCFKGLDLNSLPVCYYYEQNAWMTGEILVGHLTEFNARMQVEKRAVLLFLGNGSCHQPDLLEGRFSNITLAFLPPEEQPLELGITSTFKYHYRRMFLLHVLAKTNASSPASRAVECVDMLSCIRWVAQAWEQVKPAMILDCFQQAGISSPDLDVSVGMEDSDPVSEIDKEVGMGSLISHVMGTKPHCSVGEYIAGDSSELVCPSAEDRGGCSEGQSAGNDEDPDIALTLSKLHSYKEVVASLEDIRLFLDLHGRPELAGKAASLMTEVASCHVASLTTH